MKVLNKYTIVRIVKIKSPIISKNFLMDISEQQITAKGIIQMSVTSRCPCAIGTAGSSSFF